VLLLLPSAVPVSCCQPCSASHLTTPTGSTPHPQTPNQQLKDAAKAEKLAKRRAEAAAAAEELKARRRALGNIQYIGQLYRFGMLTENIMHRCGCGAVRLVAGWWGDCLHCPWHRSCIKRSRDQ
jgi:hypothetical protein